MLSKGKPPIKKVGMGFLFGKTKAINEKANEKTIQKNTISPQKIEQ